MDVRVGIVGTGVIGQAHLRALQGQPEFTVVGIADKAFEHAVKLAQDYKTKAFADYETLLAESRPDYLVVCTPHYTHMPIAIDAMKKGVHVFVEKPMAVTATEAAEGVRVSQETSRVLGVNYNMRPRTERQKMIELIRAGFLGELLRVTMVNTDWFRNMAYYRSGSWRATWAGEGGGILVNQAPHDLDMLIWAAGQPSAVQAWLATTGHEIEVEDTLSAILRWPNGAVGTIQANTTEFPGKSYLELAGTKGFLRLEKDILTATKLSGDSREISDAALKTSDKPKAPETVVYNLPPHLTRTLAMHQNFVAAFRENKPLICSAAEGLQEVELANALLVSGIEQRPVNVPVERDRTDRLLARLRELKYIEKAQKESRP